MELDGTGWNWMEIAADLRDKSRIKLKQRTVGRDKSDESLHRTNCKIYSNSIRSNLSGDWRVRVDHK